MKREQKPPEKKTPEKCKTCPYALGLIQTLANPCERCEEQYKAALPESPRRKMGFGFQKNGQKKK